MTRQFVCKRHCHHVADNRRQGHASARLHAFAIAASSLVVVLCWDYVVVDWTVVAVRWRGTKGTVTVAGDYDGHGRDDA